MISKIILMISSTFGPRDYKRFGVEVLEQNGFTVEIWDVFPFLNPIAYEQLKEYTLPPKERYIPFQSIQEFESALRAQSPHCFILLFFDLNSASIPIFKAITTTRIPYGLLLNNTIPPGKAFHFKSLLAKINTLTPRKLLGILKRQSPFLANGIRPAALIVADGTQSAQTPLLMGETTRILWAHTMDYDSYLEQKDRPAPPETKTGVFLDSYQPFHPDNLHSGTKPIVSSEAYYPALRRFFDYLENHYDVRIEIAAHPRSDYKPSDGFFGNRPVIKDKTAELVRKSQFVLAHFSTAINFAVLFQKPVVFITTNEIEKAYWEIRYTLHMARLLNKTPINIEQRLTAFDWKYEMTLNAEAYRSYREAYIKRQGSPEKPLWQIVSDYMKTTNLS